MGTTPLRQLLQSVCDNSCWNYAVFWKLGHENQMLLTWEDGCYDHLDLRGPEESILDNTCFKGTSEILSSCREFNGCGGHSVYPIFHALGKMEGVQYAWGQGVVGGVAHSGNHLWVLGGDISASEFESEATHEYPDEWLLQFAAGIKTILLVPVIPHGVLQLGSLDEIAEDPRLVAYVRNKFNVYQNCSDFSPFPSRVSLNHGSLSSVHIPLDNLDDLSTIAMKQMKSEDPKTVVSVKQTNDILSITNHMTQVCRLQDTCYMSGKGMLDGKAENGTRLQSAGLTKVSKPLNQSLKDTESETRKGTTGGFFGLDEELPTFSYAGNLNGGLFEKFANSTVNSYFGGGMAGNSSVNEDADNRCHKDVSAVFNFPIDGELHKALGPSFLGQTKECLWDSPLLCEDACSGLSHILNRNLILGIESSPEESNEWFPKRDEAEYLLEAVVASITNHLTDDSSHKASDVSSIVSSVQFSAFKNAQSQSHESSAIEERVSQSIVTNAFCVRGQNAITESPSSSSFESMMSTLTEELQSKKGYHYLHSRNGSKHCYASKRRVRTGENQRPRPRDRQLIQDRVKELRELVPNGSKCSIDGLLERTIKHMQFLRSVTDHADKLKQCVREGVTGWRNTKSFGSTFNSQSGTTWAFELGNDLQVCPIIVEDLENPGHMLIEMLCNDHGLFLEIAEVIRRSDLTILKGVMESHSDEMWARFIVEASRGFHRFDIFWPLMQLLQQNRFPISCKI